MVSLDNAGNGKSWVVSEQGGECEVHSVRSQWKAGRAAQKVQEDAPFRDRDMNNI